MKRKEPIYKYKYVMLLDDDDLDNFINQKTIEATHFAHKVYVTTAAKSALEFLKNISISDAGPADLFPQVIFVDLNMPMMDGFQFIDHLQKNLAQKLNSIKLVILTSSIDPNDKQKSLALSKDIIFFNKPLTKEMLIQL